MNLNMKILDKITLVLFSIIILIISILIALLMFGWVKFSTITLFYSEINASSTATNIILGSSVVCALLALRAIFFSGNSTQSGNDGILLENEAGKLLISKDTIENLVNTVARGFENTQSVTTKVYINSENELKIFLTLMVLPNTVINELSVNLQTRIKEVVKSVADLEVKAIDIRIKNITTPDDKTEN